MRYNEIEYLEVARSFITAASNSFCETSFAYISLILSTLSSDSFLPHINSKNKKTYSELGFILPKDMHTQDSI